MSPDSRSNLPEVLRVEDVAAVFGVKLGAARKAIVRGWCGPYSRVGRRLFVRRESFLAAFKSREVQPPAIPSPHFTPLPDRDFAALLGRNPV
jgi:hypothetical protein